MEGKYELIFRAARYIFLFMLITVPLTITTFTFNQSDLPKSTLLNILSSLFLVIILAAILLITFAPGKNKRILRFDISPGLDITLLMFFLAAGISTIFSINWYISLFGEYQRQVGLITLIFLFLIYFFNSIFVSDKKYLTQIIRILLFTSVAVSLYAILQQLNIDPLGLQPVGDTRPVSTIGSAVFAGGYLAMIFPLAVINLGEINNKLLKYILPLIILSGIIVTRTRSAYLAVLVELLVIFIFYLWLKKKSGTIHQSFQKNLLIAAVTTFGLMAVLLVIFQENLFVQRFFSIFSSSENQRWLIWRDAFGILGKYPITGSGIGNFANAFAEFYSFNLRFDDVNRNIDNAHNNYLQILFTMGILGLASYLFVLGSAITICFRKIFIVDKESSDAKLLHIRKIYIGLLASLTGYMIYGLTNFDELTILLNFFVLIFLIKGFSGSWRTFELKRSTVSRSVLAVSALLIIYFSGTIAFKNVNDLIADIHFLNGEKLFAGKKFKKAVNETNAAVTMCPENPFYRYKLALNVYNMVLESKTISQNAKLDLLTQAANEVSKARLYSPDVNECDALLCLIYYLSGKTDEARELGKKVLEQNKVNVLFRLKLAYQFINSGNQSAAREQLDVIKNFGYNSVIYWLTEALYYYKAGNKTEVNFYCKLILEKDPQNPDALELIKRVQ